jgi:hypothetical protein
MHKAFQKEAGRLSYVYGRDIVVNSVREFCWRKIMHDELMRDRAIESIKIMIEQEDV